jgi:hypothetical protein
MFVRFRSTPHVRPLPLDPRRLQVSVVETRWSGGRVRHEHVASLGSVPREPSVPERIAFWHCTNASAASPTASISRPAGGIAAARIWLGKC